jgi:hypothetical protein
MRGKKQLLVLATLLIFTIGLMTAIGPAQAQEGYVKIYVDQSLGYIPFEAVGDPVVIDIRIETHGFTDGAATGIVGWGFDVQVDPNVLDVNLTAGSGFPPPPPPAKVIGATDGYFLYEYGKFYGIEGDVNLLKGTSDPTTGYWKDIAETFVPNPGHGAGDYVSGSVTNLLVTLQVTSLSATQPCLIDLIGVVYKTADGNVYPAEIVLDGFYGEPPTTMSYQGSLYPGGDPTGTRWHEIHPNYCNYYDVVGWVDNGDGDLTASDQIDMVNETGWLYHYHVDKVTVTIHFTFKPDDVNPTGEEMGAEPFEPNTLESPIGDPIGSTWHQIYPDYSREFVITSWDDNGEGVFSTSDQFDFEY